jgi:signal transduction histidine kinase
VSGDPTLVARALSNLLDNAVQHAGGPELVRVRERANEVEFVVHDRGDGFAEAELPGVFESFVRGKVRPAPASLGLGLGLVRRIASAHGGRAWARNREPKGAEVGFSMRQP